MPKYIMRLDDACEKMDVEKWDKMEALLDKYGIKPLVGVIPHCEDPMMEQYPVDETFWDKVHRWEEKGWTIALHDYNHVYSTKCGGINPVNQRSEFAGEPFSIQEEKISKGIAIFREHGIEPQVFFAPSHTFDENTLRAIVMSSNIRCISDTIAWDTYCKQDITFVPQQSGAVRCLPFRTTTFCYHPNAMSDQSFEALEGFIKKHAGHFIHFENALKDRRFSFFDCLLQKMYFAKRRFK